MLPENTSGEIFSGKDQRSVHKPAEEGGFLSQQFADRIQKCCHSVDWKHPDRGSTGQPIVSSAEGVEGGKGNFQNPAEQTAVDEVVDEFSHRVTSQFVVSKSGS